MRNIRQLLVAFLMSAVVACGGGGTGTLGTGGSSNTPTLSIGVALTDAGGAASRELSKANPLRLRVLVTASSGSAANRLVSFSLNDTALASFNNGAGTAQTLSDGTAEIGLPCLLKARLPSKLLLALQVIVEQACQQLQRLI